MVHSLLAILLFKMVLLVLHWYITGHYLLSDGAAGIALVHSLLAILLFQMVLLVLHWYITGHYLLLDGAAGIALVNRRPLPSFKWCC